MEETAEMARGDAAALRSLYLRYEVPTFLP